MSANFNRLGKIHSFIALHQMSLRVGLQMSNVSLRCFAGIFLKVIAFFVLSDVTSIIISGKFVKENTNFCIGCIILLLIARMLG